MSEFAGRIVLVTGAGRGVGRDIAQAFAGQAAIVAANDITPINLDETLLSIQSAGGQAKGYVFDIAKRLPAQALVEQVVEDWGRLDILVNHANVKPRAAILDMDEWDWQRTLDVNLSGVFYLMQEAGRVMRAQGGGVIVCLGSLGGQVQALTGRAAYIASNHGLAGLTRAAATEFAAYNIRVNMVWSGLSKASINPGMILGLCRTSAAHINGQVIAA